MTNTFKGPWFVTVYRVLRLPGLACDWEASEKIETIELIYWTHGFKINVYKKSLTYRDVVHVGKWAYSLPEHLFLFGIILLAVK